MSRSRDVANIDTILTTKGDIYAATAASTPARLGVGTNGQVLTAASTTATGLQWATVSAGGQTLITTSNFPTSGSATHTINDIPNTYKHLFILIKNVRAGDGSDGVANFDMRFNGDTGNNYGYARAGTFAGGAYGQSAASVHPRLFNSTDTFRQDYAVIDIPRYTDTDTRFFTIYAYGIDQNTTPLSNFSLNVYKGSSAISSITFIAGANFAGNGVAYVYGIS